MKKMFEKIISKMKQIMKKNSSLPGKHIFIVVPALSFPIPTLIFSEWEELRFPLFQADGEYANEQEFERFVTEIPSSIICMSDG